MAKTQATKAEKAKIGRPPALALTPALLQQVRALASLMCTHREVAAVLLVAYQTWLDFKERHPEAQTAFENGQLEGKVSLRRKQFKLAEKNAGMAIFLGKNYLDQSDRQEISGPGGGPIETRDRTITPDMTDKEAAEAYEATLRS